MKERIIRLLGGCTSEEIIQNNDNSASIGRLMALYDVQDYMRQNYGESPDVWCKNVWQYVYDKIEKLTNQK